MEFITPQWPAPSHIKAFTTTRLGWSGRKPFPNSNRDNTTQDNENSLEESQKLVTLLNLPDHPIWITQTHTSLVLEATLANKEKIADASYTQSPNAVCAVLTADCLPILICNKSGTTVAAIHAGWRGLAGGIIENTIQALHLAPEDILVWLGPAIGPGKFEVGKDVFDAFISTSPESELAFIPHHENKWFANLYDLAKIRLKNQGIVHIYGGDWCTYNQEEWFFSYRRDNGKTGRMASLIWIHRPT